MDRLRRDTLGWHVNKKSRPLSEAGSITQNAGIMHNPALLLSARRGEPFSHHLVHIVFVKSASLIRPSGRGFVSEIFDGPP